MYPEFFHIGSFPIRAYGLLLALAFFSGVLYLQKVSKRDGKDFDTMLTVAYIMIFGGIVGARLAYILFHLADFSGNWGATFNPFANGQFGISGLNLQGGMILGLLGAFVYLKKKKLPIFDIFDYFMPAFGIGLAFGRMGCFFNGCCFGIPTDLPWAIMFPKDSIPYSLFGQTTLHPTQIYSALYGLIIFFLLHRILKKRKFPGQAVAITMMLEAAFRAAIEPFRYYEGAMYFSLGGVDITYNYVMALMLMITGLLIYIKQSKVNSDGEVPEIVGT